MFLGIPIFLFLRRLGTARYLSLSMIAWGTIMTLMALVQKAWQLLALRFLLVSNSRENEEKHERMFQGLDKFKIL